MHRPARTHAWLLVPLLLVGCGAPPSAVAPTPVAAEAPARLTLYSIDGTDYPPGKQPKAGEVFYGYPVLGKVEVKDAVRQREILGAIGEGIAKSDGTMAKCFWPRHAVRAVEDGKTVD